MKNLLICLLVFVPLAATGQDDDSRLPISVYADSTDADGKNSMLVFKGLRLSQGHIEVLADEGRASKIDFEDSVWYFEGNVVIDVETGHIECDSAEVHFINHELTKATIIGTPATFELKRPGSDDTTYAEGGQLDYDLRQGVVTFTDDAMITEGGNQISSSHLVYNITEQRINAASSGDGDEKVKIIYTPPDIDEEAREQAEELVEDAVEESGP